MDTVPPVQDQGSQPYSPGPTADPTQPVMPVQTVVPAQATSPVVPMVDPSVNVSQMVSPAVQYAGFGIRFVAFIIDAIIIAFISGILGGILGVFGSVLSQGSDMGVLLVSLMINLLSIVISLGYYIGMLVYHNGATIGKMLVHVKVVSVDGQPITLGKAIIRETIGKWISSIILCLGYITVAFDAKKQGWHDKIAGTYVVYNR